MKKNKSLILFTTLFCILYLILAAKPLGKELMLSPEWTKNINQKSEANPDDILIPFRLGQNLGYFTEDGRITNTVSFPFKSSITNKYYTYYGQNNKSADFYNPDGTLAGTIKEFGFPFFQEDRIFVFLPGGVSLAKYKIDGSKIFSYEYYAPITAFDSSSNGIALGYADGKIISLDNEGNLLQEYTPGGSDIPIILGIAISEDGNKIAAVSGHKKQRFSVAEKKENHTQILFHKDIEKESNRQVLVKFNKDNNIVYYGKKDSLGIADLTKLKNYSVDIPGTISQIEENSVNDFIYVLSRNDKKNTITVIESIDSAIASFSFYAKNSFIQAKNDKLFVGKDSKISAIKVSKE